MKINTRDCLWEIQRSLELNEVVFGKTRIVKLVNVQV